MNIFRQFFFFYTHQKRVLVVFVILLGLLIATSVFLPKIITKKTKIENNAALKKDIAEFQKGLQAKKEKQYSNADFTINQYPKYEKKGNFEFFEFDPNVLDYLGFIKLGLKPFIANNVIAYRKKGGKFYKQEDFSRIYGISEADFMRLKPYINIKPIQKEALYENKEKLIVFNNSKKPALQESFTVDINSADTTELKKLYGIGSYFAKQIIFYRNKLGGYYSVNQLLEINNFSADKFEKIKKNIIVDTTKIKKININWARIERLNNHPYLNFYQAKAIFELRKSKKINNLSELSKIKELSADDIEKIGHYFDFK